MNVSQNPLLGQIAARTRSHSGAFIFSARAGPGGQAVDKGKHVACQAGPAGGRTRIGLASPTSENRFRIALRAPGMTAEPGEPLINPTTRHPGIAKRYPGPSDFAF
jgi:hypothetical protein